MGSCLGASLGLTVVQPVTISAKMKLCEKDGTKTASKQLAMHFQLFLFYSKLIKLNFFIKLNFILFSFSTVGDQSSSAIEDVLGFVKGGHTGSSSGSLAIKDAKSYQDWGKSLKYNPALTEFEVHLPS